MELNNPPQSLPSKVQANVLLVDDEPANLLALEAILEDLGANLVRAQSGEEALRQSEHTEFAVVLLDVQMHGLDGFETAKLLRSRPAAHHMPIIFLTAYDTDRDQLERGYELGAVDFLVKPLVPVILRAKVAEFVGLFEEREQARRQAEQLRLLVETVSEYAIFMLDPEGHVVTWNPSAKRLKGYDAGEIIGQHFTRFYPQDAIERGWPAQELEMAKTQGRFEDEGWRVRKDGSLFWANVVITALRDEGGTLRGFSKITRDMTERRQAEENARRLFEESVARKAAEEHAEAIRQQREQLSVTLQSIGDGVISIDADGRVSLLNPVAQALTGWTADEAAGRPLLDVFTIVNEQSRQPVENPALRALREGAVVGLANHTVLIAKDGTERPIDDSAAPIRDAKGAVRGVVLAFRDVTEKRRADDAVRESEARKAAILQSALDCVITMDHEGKVIEFNSAAEVTFGYSKQQVVGRELCDLIIPSNLRERHRMGLAHYLATGEGPVLNRRLDMPAMKADGSEFPVELSIARISSDGPPMFTAYLRDISERTRIERHRNARLAITQILAQAKSVPAAASGVLEAVCENLGWDVGFFWTLNREADALRCLESWHRSQIILAEFEPTSRGRTFEKGTGLPGRVWDAGKPAWIPDVVHDASFPRAAAAAKDDLHGAFGCPIAVGGKILGVIEFFSRQIREADVDLLEMMDTVAGQIGQFMERIEAEDQLRQSEQELADFFENATIGLHWVGSDGTILRANKAELDMLGYGHDEYVNHPIAEFHADKDVICDVLKRLQAGEKLDEYAARLRCKDGSIKDVLIDSSVMWRDGEFVHTRGFTRDITERKRTEQSLRFLADASATLANVVDYHSTLQKVAGLAVPHFADWCAVDIVEPDGSVNRLAVVHADSSKVSLAREFQKLYPPDPESPRGPPQVLRTGESDMLAVIPDALLVQGAENEEHLRMLRELGLRSYMSVPLKGRGKLLGVLTFVSAESGRRYTKDDLAFAEELARRAAIAIENSQLYSELRDTDRRKDEFLATLAHELRNPLAPIRNSLQILKMPRVDTSTAHRSAEMMERQVQHLVRLVDDLMDVSRVMRSKIDLRTERVELASVVARAVETTQPLFEAQGHELTVAVAPESLPLEVDPVRLAQIIGNLLTNGAKYTEANGRIWLTAERDGNQAVLRVRDNGIGIAPDMLPHIFELFVQADHSTTRSQGGLGIGLTLVKNLVEMHQGTVEARSSGLGSGSEFVVRLPLARVEHEKPEQGEIVERRTSIPSSGHRLLVVDDNKDAADSLAMLLSLQGHEVRVAHSGPAALELARDYRPEIIFLDIGMPGMDGYEVARRLRQQPGNETVVLAALTGWGQQEDRRRSAEAGFDHHLVKPPEMKALQSLLAELKLRQR